jgi:glycosyltransferase involved in cell wall biosynthesis
MSKNDGWMFLLNSLTIGGSEKKTVNMANHLASAGHRIHLAWLCKPDTLIDAIDARVSTLYLDRRGKFDFSIPGKLRDYWKNNDISSIWCVNAYPALYAWTAARRLHKRPRLIVSNNTTTFHSRYDRLQMLVYAPVFRRFDTLVYGTELQRDLWTARYPLSGVDSRVIYNGIDTTHFTPPPSVAARSELRARYGLGTEVLCLGCVAQFRPEKAHADLIAVLERSVAQGIHTHLLLVGEGPTRPTIEELVAARGLQDRVTFLGAQGDVRETLAAMDIFILASTSVETFSNAALEAMAMQTAVILSRIGGAAEMLGEGENGITFAPGDIDELVSAVQKLADRETRDRYAANARARVCERFTFERMAEDYIATLAGDA